MEIIDKEGNRVQKQQPFRIEKNLYLGGAIAICGIVWMLYNFDIIPYRVFDRFFSWQSLLMALGGYLLVFRKWLPGIAVFLTGFAFALGEWYHLAIPVRQVILPMLLIAAGIAVMLQKKN